MLVPILCFVAACAQGSELPPVPADFDPPPVPEGYTRYLTPPIDLLPGEEVLVNQWIAGAVGADMDVIDVRGGQSRPGHHVVLYATTDVEPAGTTRPLNAEDQLHMRVIGAIGGEGAEAYKLPDGVVFRMEKGRGVVANVHYTNASSQPAVGRSYVDLKLAPASPDRKVASFFANAALTFSVPPHGDFEVTASCTLSHDLDVLLFANHMHDLGVSARTVIERPGGEEFELHRDDTWQRDWEFSPPMAHFSPKAPFTLHAGETMHTRCTWKNPGATAVEFPTEMCSGFGFFLGDKDALCADGSWVE
jgi:hypothetical protein